MPSLMKKCDLCDGVGRITIIDPITLIFIKEETCPVCRGAGAFKIYMGWNGTKSYDWRYRNTEEKEGSGDNL